MKKLIFLFIAIYSSVFSYAQQFPDSINFETPSFLVRIDTIQPNNIWQIGRPQKVFFDSAFSIPNAIITDTLHPYPASNRSSFYLYIPNPIGTQFQWGGAWGPEFSFKYKINTDSLGNAGGYIELSMDSGHTFENIANIPEFSGLNDYQNWGYGYYTDTIQDSILGFTGHSLTNWNEFSGYIYSCNYPPSFFPDTLILRFTFISDSVQNNIYNGWMIDNIQLDETICEAIHEQQSSVSSFDLFPNPSSENITLKYSFPKGFNNGIIYVYDDIGKELTHFSLSENQDTMQENTSTWPNGLYFLSLEINGNIVGCKKLIIIH